MPPEQFHGHLIHTDGPSSTPPATSQRKRTASELSTGSASPPPVKRGRGRPAGSKNKPKSLPPTNSAPKPAKATKATTKKPKKKKKTDENVPPPTIELSDSEDEIEKTSDGKIRHWITVEKTSFFQFVLGQDEVGDKRFEQHKTNPGHVYKRASELLFEGSRSAASIKSLWTRSLETFTWMLAFDSFTGNGGGDADSDDPAAVLKGRLVDARKAGLHLGSLKPATIMEWENNGWWDLFNERLGNSAKVSREIVRNSASAISGLEDNPDNDDSDSESNIHPDLRAESDLGTVAASQAPPAPKTPAATVSEPKYTPMSNFRKQASSSFGNLGEFMKMRMASEEKKASALDAKLALEREKLELDKVKAKVEMAANVFTMEGVSDEVKNAANAYLRSVFS
ncbi:hypothetical protein B0H17DRAFT_1211578 [Mycena rosella]|uniref:No apical meristem-associated C-terminal domain-containing protein n=1 Tax=Mycena rosella TaxID=1033263 RepID=A0AAD7CUF8_MYCRO|nr:hypothetical protein B0H17DRAFT_1211578 [Mycena rosella]